MIYVLVRIAAAKNTARRGGPSVIPADAGITPTLRPPAQNRNVQLVQPVVSGKSGPVV